jgi:hypothetical protein
MRFAATGLRIFVIALACTAPALAQDGGAPASAPDTASSAESTVPDELQGMVGDFILAQEDESLPTCPITFTDQQSIGGWAIELPETCPAPYPVDRMATWNIDQTDGSVLITDAERHLVMKLFEDEDGLYDTAPDTQPRFYLMPPYDAEGAGGEADSN